MFRVITVYCSFVRHMNRKRALQHAVDTVSRWRRFKMDRDRCVCVSLSCFVVRYALEGVVRSEHAVCVCYVCVCACVYVCVCHFRRYRDD